MRLPIVGLLLVGLVVTIHAMVDEEAVTLQDVINELRSYKNIVGSLTTQVMMQQLYAEEMTRSTGDSGIKQVRVNRIGTNSYHSDSHTLNAVMSIHDHANFINTVGLGEFIAVLNGVEFRTRHNDYKLTQPAPTGSEWGVMNDIEFPPVPPSVLEKPTLQAQIHEMRAYFKKFKRGENVAPYFKPVLCYLEGMWTVASEKIDEPFPSDRHAIDAATWFELNNKIKFTGYSGRKSTKENFSFLPMKIMELVNGTVPSFAQWNYRIACQPLDGVWLSPTKLKLVDDIGVRLAYGIDMEDAARRRSARFRLPAKRLAGNEEGFYTGTNGVLDEMMEQVPGRDGADAVLHDDSFGEPAYHPNAPNRRNATKLNTAYYHRFYKTLKNDAMGSRGRNRGFSDRSIFMAMTSNPKVAPMTVNDCKGRRCTEYTQRWTYAVPLEIIYLTPLSLWNPFNIEYKGHGRSAAGRTIYADGRNGSPHDPTKAFNGTNHWTYYMTPDAFFSGGENEGDPADTAKAEAGVLNKEGELCKVRASGIRIHLPEIKGVGKIRLRYPIAPIFAEGSAIYKECEALKQIVTKPKTYGDRIIERNYNGKPKCPKSEYRNIEGVCTDDSTYSEQSWAVNECGDDNVGQSECEHMHRCCWDGTNEPANRRCYVCQFEHNLCAPPSVSGLAGSSRINCGVPGITEQQCEGLGCCFDRSVRGRVSWCYKRALNIRTCPTNSTMIPTSMRLPCPTYVANSNNQIDDRTACGTVPNPTAAGSVPRVECCYDDTAALGGPDIERCFRVPMECASGPCQNGGTCAVDTNPEPDTNPEAYTCICAPGYANGRLGLCEVVTVT